MAGCRNAAAAMADRLQFPAARAGQLALAVTEAASNLHKHAEQGSLLLAVSRDVEPPGIVLVTIDAGRGWLTPARPARRPFHRGHARGRPRARSGGWPISATCTPCRATGRRWRRRFRPGPCRRRAMPARGLVRPSAGEAECGDAYGAVQAGDIVTAVLCDGLGHGPLAAAAATAGVAAVLEEPAERARRAARAGSPADERYPRRGHRRGAGRGPVARFAGLGNIAASILSDGSRKSMVSVPGIAGHQARTIRQFEYQVPPGAAVVLHSDGITSRWEAAALPGVAAKDPLLIAAVLLAKREFTAMTPASSC